MVIHGSSPHSQQIRKRGFLEIILNLFQQALLSMWTKKENTPFQDHQKQNAQGFGTGH